MIRLFRIGGDGFLLASIFPGLPFLNLRWQAVGALHTAALGVFKTETAHLKRSSFGLLKQGSQVSSTT